MTDWNGFDKGVIGRKLPSDKTLNNMRKADLIELLHIAEDNHNVLAFAYKNAVDNSKCNKCPIPKMSAEHDKYIREEVIEEINIILKNMYLEISNTVNGNDYTSKNDLVDVVASKCRQYVSKKLKQLKEDK